jgi:hypothetical protein
MRDDDELGLLRLDEVGDVVQAIPKGFRVNK